MRYRFRIKFDMDQDELSNKLKENYRFPLLNFAFVISDVLAENSIFSPTFLFGKKISDIKREIAELKETKSEIKKLVENYLFKFYFPYSAKVLRELSPEKLEKLYISEFKLKPFFNNIDDSIKELEKKINIRKIDPVANITLWPFFRKHRRSFSFTNQISFLWASVLREKNGIHWANICDLLNWFYEHLEDSTYKSKLCFLRKEKDEKVGYPKVLKNQYRRIKKSYRYQLASSSNHHYFPHKNKPEKPYLFSNPVISIKFYHNKIKTIYKEKNKLKVRETLFEHSRKKHEIREYEKDEEKKEISKWVWEII